LQFAELHTPGLVFTVAGGGS